MGQFILGLLIVSICAVFAVFGGNMAVKGWKKWRHPETEINSVLDHVDNGTESVKKHIDEKLDEKFKEMDKSLDEKIRAYNKRLIRRVDPSDPRLKDGGKIGVSVVLHTIDSVGGLIDFGDPLDPKKNGIFLSIKRKRLILKLYDMNGEKHVLEGTFQPKINKKARIECVWSSKYAFVALIYNEEIIARMQFPRLSMLIDFSKISILRLRVGLEAPIHIANLEIYAEKELAKK